MLPEDFEIPDYEEEYSLEELEATKAEENCILKFVRKLGLSWGK